MTKEILVNNDKCLGCRSCEIACALAHSEAKSLTAIVVTAGNPLKSTFINQDMDKKLPLTCRYSEETPCVDTCISGVMDQTSENGLVIHEEAAQTGTTCWMCALVCPYGVNRSLPEEHKALKCDRICFEDTNEPACVRACPTGALMYTTVEEFERKLNYGIRS